MILRRCVGLALAAALTLAVPAWAGVPDDCDVPEDLLRLDTPLKRTASKLVPGGVLTIVTIGSSSTFGAGASEPSMAYPSQLKRRLSARFPKTKIRVINRGVNGEVVADMIARWEKDVVALAPDLVVWQVGANSALRATHLEGYAKNLREGVRRAQGAGADIVLMDPQYAPKVLARPIVYPVLAETDAVARETGAGLFRRFEIMRHWVQGGFLTFPVILDADQIHLNDRGYGCIAETLADAIVAAAQPTPPD